MTRQEEATVFHHIVYWEVTKREVDVDNADLSELRQQERRGEVYIEFLDGQRLPLIWDHNLSEWVAAAPARHVVTA
jgi:hypothetical protein